MTSSLSQQAINPNTTIIMYFNSMMDFTMYNMAAKVDELEAAGTRILLRDANDDMVILCNDGNYYCDVKFYDWSKEAARNLWTQHVRMRLVYPDVCAPARVL